MLKFLIKKKDVTKINYEEEAGVLGVEVPLLGAVVCIRDKKRRNLRKLSIRSLTHFDRNKTNFAEKFNGNAASPHQIHGIPYWNCEKSLSYAGSGPSAFMIQSCSDSFNNDVYCDRLSYTSFESALKFSLLKSSGSSLKYFTLAYSIESVTFLSWTINRWPAVAVMIYLPSGKVCTLVISQIVPNGWEKL